MGKIFLLISFEEEDDLEFVFVRINLVTSASVSHF